MSIDQRMHLAGDPGLRQRFGNEVALPGAVSLGVPMLDRAAAAHAEMPAERGDPFRARALDLEQPPTVGMALDGLGLDRLAAERVGHIHILPADDADAVAEMADMIDDRGVRCQPRRAPRKNSMLPSPPVIDDGNTWISVQPSDVAKAAMLSQIS